PHAASLRILQRGAGESHANGAESCRKDYMAFLATRGFGGYLALLALAGALPAGARAQAISEYQVKAAFLYNFARFVQWPPQSFKNAHDPIAICVLGPNPFGDA